MLLLETLRADAGWAKNTMLRETMQRHFFLLPYWFGFAWFYNTLDSGPLKIFIVSQSLYSSGSVKGHNLSCFEVLGRELLVLQKEWKRCAGCNWGKHAQITSKKSSHFPCYRIESPFQLYPLYLSPLQCTSTSNETCGALGFPCLQGWKR